MNYYNEFDHNAAMWIRELIKLGVIADGVVDERSIKKSSQKISEDSPMPFLCRHCDLVVCPSISRMAR